jgi:gluconokinase
MARARCAHDINTTILDGDYLYPRANINKIAARYSLNDNDRTPWLVALNDAIFTHGKALIG